MNIKRKLNKIIKFKKDLKTFGFDIALGNLLWIYLGYLPSSLAWSIQKRKNKAIEKYLSKTLDISISDSKYQRDLPNCNKGNKYIWICWWQGINSAPELVKQCIERIKKLNSDCTVVVLSKENLKQYIELPEIYYKHLNKGNITITHFSDIIRIALLARYGGVWMDSTIFTTERLPDSFFSSDFFSIKIAPTYYYCHQCRWAAYLQGSKGGSRFFLYLNDVLLNYWEKNDNMIEYFLIDYLILKLYRESNEFAKIVDIIPFSNPHIFDLQSLLNKPYDGSVNNIMKDTSIFKLSWREKVLTKKNGKETNWGKLIS